MFKAKYLVYILLIQLLKKEYLPILLFFHMELLEFKNYLAHFVIIKCYLQCFYIVSLTSYYERM